MARTKRFIDHRDITLTPLPKTHGSVRVIPLPQALNRELHQAKLQLKKQKKTAKNDRVIKWLVSPREVVFRFPFQLEVDWAFQGRSAVKSELYMRGPEDT